MTEDQQALYQICGQTVDHLKSLIEDIKSERQAAYISRIQELENELSHLKRNKRYGLVWEDKPEDVVEQCKTNLPVLEADESRTIQEDPDGPTHLLIEGDNYHALSVLAYTHAKKVDVIYIDPPYNTGNKDFIYNDHFVDKEDTFRHSKWLSFMKKRLLLAQELLSDDGVIFISIGEDELNQLKLLCDEIFDEKNYITNFIWEKTQHFGRQKVNSYSNADYILCYGKQLQNWGIKELLVEKIKGEHGDAPLYNKSNPFNTLTIPAWTVVFNIPDGEYIETSDDKYTLMSKVIIRDGKNINNLVLRFRSRWSQRNLEEEVWKWTTFWVKSSKFAIRAIYWDGKTSHESPKQILFTNSNNEFCARSRFEQKIGVNEEGSAELLRIIGEQNVFDYPKPKTLIAYLLSLIFNPYLEKHHRDLIVLDFFAGSGTTGHAVLELNKEDGGKRQCILCTNNENHIAEEVTYPRMRNVINGYADVPGIPANLRYYHARFIDNTASLDDVRTKFIHRCNEMLQIRESCFTSVATSNPNPDFQVFENVHTLLAIVYHPYQIASLQSLSQTATKPIVAYIFSVNMSIFQIELNELADTVRVETIPDEILETYKKLFGL